ncbi:MAG: hypothetical protein L6Q46_09475 [Flavobacterium sp.]|uniref:hypothetical protein n=1 Tax=Flavobacterium sp. TaxID=239 RepID=UPI0025BF9507|nr:hypothetical protein [Flavobacterium sp.]MCK6608515.1 hypothetical protein [Flavobacterium sp.]
MEILKNKLERITEFWNDFVWEYKTIQNCILWNDEIKTNYYGDILSYFNETFDIIESTPERGDFQKSIFYSTGLLQIIYVHQDLTDELLTIFKVAKSTKKDKDPNREIRNELIGHPINKDQKSNELLSSIFWGRNLTTSNIHYIKYSKDNNFSGIEKSFAVSEIINTHKTFLNKYFDLILDKIRKISKSYIIKLKELENVILKDDFNLIVELTSIFFEHIFITDYLYKEEILKECYQRKDEHIRYRMVVENFKKDLLQMLVEKQEQINEICSESTLNKTSDTEIFQPKVKISFITSDKINNNKSFKKKDYHYEIQKLFVKHPIWGVSYFKEEFKDDVEILNELNNMETNIDNDLEYYSSFYYLKSLIKLKIEQPSQ